MPSRVCPFYNISFFYRLIIHLVRCNLILPLFLLCDIWRTWPHLNICSLTDLDLCALSRHRCWRVFLFFSFVVDKKVMMVVGRLITIALSITSFTDFMSWVLADDIDTEIGIPCLSVKMCRFVPSLLLSVGLFLVMSFLRWFY